MCVGGIEGGVDKALFSLVQKLPHTLHGSCVGSICREAQHGCQGSAEIASL